LSPLRAVVRPTGARAVAAARARPWHAAVGALVAGMALAPRAPALVLVAAAGVPLLAERLGRRLLLAAIVLAGGVFAQARMHAVDATRLAPGFGHALAARVVLLEPPRERAFGARAATVSLDHERVLLRASRAVRWPTERVGAVLAVRGGLRPLPAYERWRRARGVHAELRADEVSDTGLRRAGLAGVIDGARVRSEHALQTGVPAAQGALLRGMALGDDAALPDDVREEFRASGLSHLVAASGQNVMLLAALGLAMATAIGLGLRARLAVVLALIALYVPLAGAGASIQRAGVMGAAGLVAVLAGRPADRWHAVLLAAAVTLGLNPRATEDVGWQLSFAAVVAILLLSRRIANGLQRRGMPLAAAEAVALTLAATVGSAPLIALHFGQTSLISLPANVAAAPAVAPTMWLAMLACAAAQLSPALASPLASLAAVPAAYLTWVADVASRLPGGQARAPVVVVALVCAAVAISVLVRRSRRGLAAGAALAVALAAVAGTRASARLAAPNGLRVTFLDIGQGDATLLQDQTTSVLVDTGPPEGPILARLRGAGVRRLDVLVLTHAQADHDGGAAAVLRTLPVRLVLDGRDGVREPFGARMAAEALRRHVRLIAGRAGQVLRVGRLVVRVLWPPAVPAALKVGGDPNQRAIVAEVDGDGVRTLLTADAESDVLDGIDLGEVDILKVSHHGSADDGLPGLLERLRPRLAGIEVGRHNSYGHPAASTLRALRSAGVPFVRTDLDGSVRVDPSGGALAIHAHA
jgi:competence protein ComEC